MISSKFHSRRPCRFHLVSPFMKLLIILHDPWEGRSSLRKTAHSYLRHSCLRRKWLVHIVSLLICYRCILYSSVNPSLLNFIVEAALTCTREYNLIGCTFGWWGFFLLIVSSDKRSVSFRKYLLWAMRAVMRRYSSCSMHIRQRGRRKNEWMAGCCGKLSMSP
jgi:hypothetical protein